MKYLITVISILTTISLSITFTSCGSNDCSNPSDWVGIYTLQSDSICTEGDTLSFVSQIELELSSVAETFEYEGGAFGITDCTATDGFFAMELDGDNLTVEIIGSGCSWEFRR